MRNCPMSAKIITIAIEKGGTGKTVTASNLAYLMGDEGKKFFAWILIRREISPKHSAAA